MARNTDIGFIDTGSNPGAKPESHHFSNWHAVFLFYGIPEGLRPGLERYITQGVQPGGFLTAVLENDLFGAMTKADPLSDETLADICRLIYNEFPSSSWGNPDKIKLWKERFK